MSSEFNFPIATPESQGLASGSILAFIDELEKEHIGIHSLIIMRHGNIIAEGYWKPFRAEKAHRLFSAAKAISMCSILFALQEGIVSVDTPMIEIFPDKMPAEPSQWLKK